MQIKDEKYLDEENKMRKKVKKLTILESEGLLLYQMLHANLQSVEIEINPIEVHINRDIILAILKVFKNLPIGELKKAAEEVKQALNEIKQAKEKNKIQNQNEETKHESTQEIQSPKKEEEKQTLVDSLNQTKIESRIKIKKLAFFFHSENEDIIQFGIERLTFNFMQFSSLIKIIIYLHKISISGNNQNILTVEARELISKKTDMGNSNLDKSVHCNKDLFKFEISTHQDRKVFNISSNYLRIEANIYMFLKIANKFSPFLELLFRDALEVKEKILDYQQLFQPETRDEVQIPQKLFLISLSGDIRKIKFCIHSKNDSNFEIFFHLLECIASFESRNVKLKTKNRRLPLDVKIEFELSAKILDRKSKVKINVYLISH